MDLLLILMIAGGLAAAVIAAVVVISLMFRQVVHPNEVHIVQSQKGKVSYGVTNRVTGESDNGNAYYTWPEWIPFIGVTVTQLPLSNFSINLPGYEAYDQRKVPFVIDLMAFFRIEDPNLAAARIEDFHELKAQMQAIMQGAARTMLAGADIEQIMMDRQVFGENFTKEVSEQLEEWGVVPVKNIELMDIRDPADGSSQVITNIQAKEQSRIEMESRQEVAENIKNAEIKEIETMRERDVARQDAEQKVGERTAQKDREVGIANEQSRQAVAEQAKETAERNMAVIKVEDLRRAEIDKDVNVVKAQEDKEVNIVKAQGEREQMKLKSEGELIDQENEAKGTLAIGKAAAEAKKLDEMAVVTPQIALAQEIGENAGYQHYLVSVEQVHATRDVGIEQAQALKVADLKVIANSGDVNSGVTNVMDIFSPKGGTALGGMLEGLKNTPEGDALLRNLGVKSGNAGEDTTSA